MTWVWIVFACVAIVCLVALPRFRPAIMAFLVLVSATEAYIWYTRNADDNHITATLKPATAPPEKKQLRYASRTVIRKSDVEIESAAVKPVFGKLYLVTALLRNGSEHAVRRLSLSVKIYDCRRRSDDIKGCGFMESQTARFDSDGPLIQTGRSRTVQANVYLNTAPRNQDRLRFAYEISEIEAAALPN